MVGTSPAVKDIPMDKWFTLRPTQCLTMENWARTGTWQSQKSPYRVLSSPLKVNNEIPIEFMGADQSFMLQKTTWGNCASIYLQLKALKFTSGATFLSSLALYSWLQHLKVSPCVQSDQKPTEINRKMPRRHFLCNLWSWLSAGLKMTELQSTEHMNLEVSRTSMGDKILLPKQRPMLLSKSTKRICILAGIHPIIICFNNDLLPSLDETEIVLDWNKKFTVGPIGIFVSKSCSIFHPTELHL